MTRLDRVMEDIENNLTDLTDWQSDAWAMVEFRDQPIQSKFEKYILNNKDQFADEDIEEYFEKNKQDSFNIMILDLQCIMADLFEDGKTDELKKLIKKVYYK